jgi:hypothetical protein
MCGKNSDLLSLSVQIIHAGMIFKPPYRILQARQRIQEKAYDSVVKIGFSHLLSGKIKKSVVWEPVGELDPASCKLYQVTQYLQESLRVRSFRIRSRSISTGADDIYAVH